MSREGYQRWAQEHNRPGCVIILLLGFATAITGPLLLVEQLL